MLDIQVKLLDDKVITGSSPIVILGPNGVGKTRLGVGLTRKNSAERISAFRLISFSAPPMKPFENAKNLSEAAIQQNLGQWWTESNEYTDLMTSLIEGDKQAAVEYRLHRERDSNAIIPQHLIETNLIKVKKTWELLFPGRTIEIDYAPRVTTKIGGQEESYNPAQMSEGERTALYLISRVISSKSGLLFVDKPELYFHPLLARHLWDTLEAIRQDIRFIYITHDIAFGLSRRHPRFLIAKSFSEVEVVAEKEGVPPSIAFSVLGAASLSISAVRVIFCEGKTNSYDLLILSAYYDSATTAVVAAGGCSAVRDCVNAFTIGKTVQNLKAFGHIDRDTWPDAYLTGNSGVKPLPFYEIEGIVMYKPIFLALAEYYKSENPAALYEEAVRSGKLAFRGAIYTKEILNRLRQRVEIEQRSMMNNLSPSDDVAVTEVAFKGSGPCGGWTAYLERFHLTPAHIRHARSSLRTRVVRIAGSPPLWPATGRERSELRPCAAAPSAWRRPSRWD